MFLPIERNLLEVRPVSSIGESEYGITHLGLAPQHTDATLSDKKHAYLVGDDLVELTRKRQRTVRAGLGLDDEGEGEKWFFEVALQSES